MKKQKNDFTFIDLFAGIGGLRKAFEPYGTCLFSSELNEHSKKTYCENFPGSSVSGDITKISLKDIPDHDILLAGFPCQPFSLAGVSSRESRGQKHGFKDKTQGTLFFDICRILEEKQPRAFLLENVKNLRTHDKKKTFNVIINSLKELGYHVNVELIDSGKIVPQHRERIFIVGFKEPLDFEFPELKDTKPQLKNILQKKVDKKYTLLDGTWNALQRHKKRHTKKGNGFGYAVANKNGISNTLSARYCKDGAEILIDALNKLQENRIEYKEQDLTLITKAPKINNKMLQINWAWSAEKINNWVRGLSPLPGMVTIYNNRKLKLFKTAFENRIIDSIPGEIITASDVKLEVCTGKGILSILELQQEGKTVLSIENFLRGSNIKIGDVFH